MESANVVGYQNITIPGGWSFFTVTFKDMGTTSMNLQKITSLQANGDPWKTSGSSNTKCAGNITVQKTDAEGHFLERYQYFSTKTPQGWYKNVGVDYVEDVTLENGEGLIINNDHGKGACLLVVSGEVDLMPGRMLPAGWSFCGNFTPVEIDIQQITSCQANGDPWKTSGSSNTKCAGNITVQKTDAEGHFLERYQYFSTKTPQGWYKNVGVDYVENVKFAPGEGFIVNNDHGKGPCQLLFPSPIQEAAK